MESFDILGAISTVGFPIVACIAMFYFAFTMINEIKSMVEKNNETNYDIATTLKEVTKEITDIRIQIAKLESKFEAKINTNE